MKDVKRYESGVHYCSGDAMVQSTEGDYVSYEDYAALKAERDALAAENLAIKAKVAIHAAGFSVCPVCSHEDPSETDDIVWMVNETPTPATDAYANLRKDGE